jgi:hypothetical protein
MTLLDNAQASSTNLPLSSLPALNSDPGATDSIYLDFVGAPAMTWLAYSVPATPAYDQDGDPTTFSSAELTSITEIWQGVAEEYSPFNINVTTVAPAALVHGQNMELIIGGSGSWLGAAAGGVSYIGAFATSYLPNISFVFPGELANGTPKYTADAAAHEAGHEFGLYHQATWSGTTLVADYSTGTPADGPVMGDPYGDTRATWFDGTNDVSSTTIQDDMAVISGSTNGFGYRNDGISHAIGSPTDLTGTSPSDSGIISTTSQVDYYEFSTGAGSISLSASQFSIPGVFDGMLSLKFSLYNANDQLVTSSGSGLTESINTTVAAGSYIVAISSDGSYGDVGQYTFSGTVVATPPAAPTSLSATAASTSAINLSWSDTTGDATGYYVERSPDDSTWTQVGSTTSTTYQDTGLSAGTTYYYRIQAYNGGGDSSFTSVASAATQSAAPTAPTSLLATATSTSAISLSWTDNSNNETGFYVERSPDNSTWTQIATLNANVTTYNDSSLSSATTYYYRVRAYNAGGNSAYTNTSSATTQTTPPNTPSTLAATAVSTTEIDLAWTDNSNQTGFYIERSPDNSTWTQIASTTSTSYHDTGLSSATTYYYRICAYNAGGDSSYTSVSSATTQTPVPNAPTTLLATATSTSAISLSWTDNSSNETGFYVERSPDDSSWTQIASLGANVTTYNDSSLSSATTYYYRVRAYNAGGNSAYTNVSSATTQTPAPGVPTAFSATAVSTTEIDLAWTDNSNQTGFYIERSPDNSTWTQIGSTTATSYHDTSLASSTTFYYRVRAYNAGGDSAYTSAMSATTLTPIPAAPTTLVATANSTTQITIGWTDNSSNETGFYIERSPDNSTWTQIASVAANSTSYINTGLSASTAYYYRVRAYNAGGDSAYTNVANATTLTPIAAVPTNLVATPASTSAINLTWTDNSNQTGFYIERSPDNSTWTQIGSTTSTSYQDTGLSSTTTYYYRVSAYNAGGNSAYTTATSATTLTPIPTAPSTLVATAASTTQVTLTWVDNSSNETGFYIERSPDDSTWTQITSVAANTTTYNDTGLSSSTAYYYRVRAYNAGGDSAYTNVSNATTLTPIPSVPSSLVATVASASEIDLTWADSSNQTGFYVERSPDNSTWTQIASTTSTSYQDTGLSSATTYYYRVRAYNAGGDSGYATTASATTQMLAPAAPSGLSATSVNTAEIDLAWTNNASNAAGVYIERSSDNNTWTQIASVSATTTSYDDTGLTIGASYFYRIRAFNAGGDSAYAGTASAVAYPLIAPPMPAQSVAAAPASFSQVSLSWVASPGDSGFYVERSVDRITWTTIAQLPQTATTFQDTTADSDTHYFYRVIAYNALGDAPASNLTSATTPVYSVILDNASSSDVTIAGPWSHSTALAGYFGTDFLQDNNLNKGQSSVTFAPTLPESGVYQVSIRWTSAPNRADNVPVTITYNGGSIVLLINQRQNGSKWVTLGSFNFLSGSAGSVEISNANTDGAVVADAAQFVKVSDTPLATYRISPNMVAAPPSMAAVVDDTDSTILD